MQSSLTARAKQLLIILLVVFFTQVVPLSAAVAELESGAAPPVSLETQPEAEVETTASPEDNNPVRLELPAPTLPPAPDMLEQQPRLIRPRPVIHQLNKPTYQASEYIMVRVEHSPDDLEVELTDSEGTQIQPDVAELHYGAESLLRIEPPVQLRPGKYRLRIITSDGAVSEQNFVWGVLAINTNKSIYQPNDTAKIHMAVLNGKGNMECSAKVKLSIKDPKGTVFDHSTETSSIKVNPECEKKEFTLIPDFESRFSVRGGEGTYTMTLTAQTKNGTYTITDSFQAKQEVPFDIERLANTRIFPPLRYPVALDIVAREDFTGKISEVVPESFDIGTIENMLPFSVKTYPSRAKNGSSDISLGLPFDGDFKKIDGFGEEEDDPLLAGKYQKYGVTGHDGVDYDVPPGTAIAAVDDGTVVRASTKGDYGTTIVVEHTWGKSYYGHLSQMSASAGDTIKKGQQLGLSGDTGVSTGPQLHFGIKLSENNVANGYYGKIDPERYLARESSSEAADAPVKPGSGTRDGVKVLTWDVTIHKGESLKLGYTYLAPPESPQFYTAGPLDFASANGGDDYTSVFREARPWQIAVDADGSGTNTVTPTTGQPSTTGNTYTFTFTPSENMDSGSIQIQVPSSGSPDWSAPTDALGGAGYTRATGNVNATVARVLNSNDSATGWAMDDADFCTSLVLDTSAVKEGTGSMRCDNAPASAGPDNNDSFRFDGGGNLAWTSICGPLGVCTQVGYWIMRTGGASGTNAEFAWGSGTDLQATRIGGCAVPATASSGVWVYAKCTLSGTLTTINSYGFICTNNTCNPFETADVNIDDLLIGPGAATFSGRNINIRLLDATTGDTVTVDYGAFGGVNGATNSSTLGAHTFTTLSKTSVSGTLTNIASSPTITIAAGPSNDQLMRHGSWFDGGAQQPFTF